VRRINASGPLRGDYYDTSGRKRATQYSTPDELSFLLIAGDLNMPSLSPTSHRIFSDYQDGFEQAGWGFGHTFPNRSGLRMWLRLDRILASRELAFVDFELGCMRASDHYCVVAELQRR